MEPLLCRMHGGLRISVTGITLCISCRKNHVIHTTETSQKEMNVQSFEYGITEEDDYLLKPLLLVLCLEHNKKFDAVSHEIGNG